MYLLSTYPDSPAGEFVGGGEEEEEGLELHDFVIRRGGTLDLIALFLQFERLERTGEVVFVNIIFFETKKKSQFHGMVLMLDAFLFR